MKISETLKNKNILFISVKFFNYEVAIKKQLEDMGATVNWFDERPSNSVYTKAMIRINKNFVANAIHKHFNNIIAEIKNAHFDYFLLIKGEATPQFFLEYLRKNHPHIIFVFYTWDSFKNNSSGLKIINFFDYKFTFDSEDAKKYNIGFRPLFFTNEYAKLFNQSRDFKNDITFIGTAHSDRYTITEKVRMWCVKNNMRLFTFYYAPNKLLFHFNKLTKKDFQLFDLKKISFKSLSHDDIIEIYKYSKVILDINHPGQKGLTMRTFESLGAGRKLITTNPEVKKYPFYNEQNIYIIDRNTIHLNKKFFETDFSPIDQSLLRSMSLEGMLEEILGLKPNVFWKDF